MQKNIVYLNGKFLPAAQAKISVFDRGFLFGDGVYEIIPVFNGNSFGLREHLLRLKKSLAAIKIVSGCFQIKNMEKILLKLLRINQTKACDYAIYLQITRGVTKERNFNFPKKILPTIFATIKPILPFSYSALKQGKTAITLEDIRWKHCNIKTIALLPSVLLYQQVYAANCDEGILIRNGFVLEGISSNIFVIKKGKIYTPPLTGENLGGVTRDLLLKLLAKTKLPVIERKIKQNELKAADEIWVSSSSRGIFPIVKLDGRLIKNGKPGPIWEKAIAIYLEYRNSVGRHV
ncbi:MAG: aminotransferase class IV [Gammaproteobacteria bacterium]|nr:aminotransferase class IV [Gammaproteobacteria bacterium]